MHYTFIEELSQTPLGRILTDLLVVSAIAFCLIFLIWAYHYYVAHSKKLYLQQGPTCCFYAIGKVKQLITKTNVETEVITKIINELDDEKTRMGEVFDIEYARDIARSMGLEATIKPLTEKTLNEVGEKYGILFIQMKTSPHCLLLRFHIGPFFWFWEGVNGIHFLPMNKKFLIYQNHKIISSFNWNKWFSEEHIFNKRKKSFGEFFQERFKYLGEKEFDNQKTNLKGQILLIEKGNL